MAKSDTDADQKVNRSQAIRDYMEKNPEAKQREIKEALEAEGISVSNGLISRVKYGAPPKGTGRGGRRKSTTAKKKTVKVARKSSASGKMNMSAMIKEVLAEDPDAKPKAIIAAVQEKYGVTVQPSLVSGIKNKNKKAGGAVKTRKVSVRKSGASSANGLSIEQLISVKKFVDSNGGVAQVRSALDALERLNG